MHYEIGIPKPLSVIAVRLMMRGLDVRERNHEDPCLIIRPRRTFADAVQLQRRALADNLRSFMYLEMPNRRAVVAG